METLALKIEGMSCASCASSIEKSISKINGVLSCSVNYATEKGYFELDNESLVETIQTEIINLGYSFQEGNESSKDANGKDENLRKFLISIILSIALFIFAMWPLMNWPDQRTNWFIQLILATPVWLWIGSRFQKSALNFFLTGKSNMNTLIGIGTTAAFVYSSFITIFHELSVNLGLTQKVHFEAVGFIISFVFLGQYFEEKAKKKTKEALNSLFKLSSKKAFVKRGDDFIEVDISKVQVNDTIRVKPGEKFPVDGKITKGESNIDEAMITGEPIPVSKKIGDSLFAGTINGESVIEYNATKVGGDTFLSQIVKFVETAQSSKPQIQRYADKISSVFTPAVLVISVITFIMWFFFGPEPVWGNAISNFIAVLVIACPCALGLATPTAVVVATGRASLKGLLIGGGEVIEKAQNIDAIIFDKTGTLTEGRPSVIDYICTINHDKVLFDVASIEQFSEHPLSKAILNFYQQESDRPLDEPDLFEVIKGKGLVADLNDDEFVIGNMSLMKDHKLDVPSALSSQHIGSTVYVAKNKEVIALFVIGDQIKKQALDSISKIKDMGIQTWMITGDNEAVAQDVANELGIDHFMANVLPLDKSTAVESLQKKGLKVAMVGDGINDAPALSKADLSLAMGTGTDVAINAADVTIVHGDISKALDFIILSTKTMKVIKENLFLSMIYNTLLIPIAAGVLYLFGGPLMPPVLASVAMALSSISVVSNSLRIRKFI
ncbi:heavy metal translocating P-type ATPase [Halobacteriovorax sp. GB3]|uniref:heavy metal translocating P-type ATPase n=1 Tax=Halobacteriovorax sp. GB3 TaxID=2719615 RepID=UPI0023624199|nr:heavy metal translocating P-type ATPase [Halobacteriovorax sp. GB3]MDD0851746.1 heavy metal translocating P-type ATPase [Halobacteriovorax sp. GB3]